MEASGRPAEGAGFASTGGGGELGRGGKDDDWGGGILG